MALLAGDHALLVEMALPVCARYGLAITGGYAVKALVLPSGGACRVDILKEPLNHEPAMMSFGPVVALEDVVALKVETDLVTMARAALDDEFRFGSLRDQLDRAQMYPDEELASTDSTQVRVLPSEHGQSTGRPA
jgi:hypothetical protein